MEDNVYELNYASARLAYEAYAAVAATDPTRPRFVVGTIGPTNHTRSISPSVENASTRNASTRNVTFDKLVESYFEQVVTLVDDGLDILNVKTIFDTLNANAAFYAIGEYLEVTELDILVFVSGILVDQTGEVFYISIRHAKLMCIGLNYAFGANHMVPFVERLFNIAERFMHVYSNAGLPNAIGGYNNTPEQMTEQNETFSKMTGLIWSVVTLSYNLAAHILVHSYPAIAIGEAQHVNYFVESLDLTLPADITASGFYITNLCNRVQE